MTKRPAITHKFAQRSAHRLAAAAALAAITTIAHAQSVSAVSTLDKRSFTGSWYEVARLPNKREKHCASDAIELIALGDKPNQLQIVDACTDLKYFKDSWNFLTVKDNGSGALKVRTNWPLSRKYWVLAVGPIVPVEATAAAAKPSDSPPVVANAAAGSTTSIPPEGAATAMPAPPPGSTPKVAPPTPPPPTGYAWTLIGTPNHKQLWIYARTRTLPADELDQVKAKASAMGFMPEKLVVSPQTGK